MKIILLDVDAHTRQFISDLIRDYGLRQNIDFHFQLLQDWNMALQTDFSDADGLFIDTGVFGHGRGDGFSLAKSVKSLQEQYHYRFGVVFIASDLSFCHDAFQANALHYLCRPLQPADVEEALARLVRLVSRKKKQVLRILSSYKTILIPINTIQYIEVFNNCSAIHTDKEIIRTYTSLTTLYKQLDPRLFMKPHRSYIVSMKMIEQFNYDHITLKNELVITLSRNNRSALKQQYYDYLLEQE